STPPAPSFPPSTRRGRRSSPTRSEPPPRAFRIAGICDPARAGRSAAPPVWRRGYSTLTARPRRLPGPTRGASPSTRTRDPVDDRRAALVLRDGGRDPQAVGHALDHGDPGAAFDPRT